MELPPLFTNLTRPLVCFDIESTGKDVQHDRIIELGVVRITPGSGQPPECHSWRFNPGIPIPPEATAIHGITDADVADCPSLYSRSLELRTWFTDCDLAGFNVRQYDLPLIKAEFARHQIAWCAEDAQVLDSMFLFHKLVKRDLSAAVNFYLKRPHAGAHGAVADCQATLEVLAAQMQAHPELADMLVPQLGAYCQEVVLNGMPAVIVDAAGKLARTADGVVRYTFGKWQGASVLAQTSYARWMLTNDFPESTKAALRKLLSA